MAVVVRRKALYVITSYSIHYTKLYDDAKAGLMVFLVSVLSFTRLAIVDSTRFSAVSPDTVITSYSIHYTKLYEFALRVMAGGLTEFQVDIKRFVVAVLPAVFRQKFKSIV